MGQGMMGEPERHPISRSGRFVHEVAKEVAKFTESVSFDHRLWKQDIAGSKAHAKMLLRLGILSEQECNSILKELDQIANEIEQGSFHWREEMEDVHMNIEFELTRRTAAGAKLHTARSRNDQIALDMRLWVREEIDELSGAIRQLQKALVDLADANRDVLVPGYTHLQRAQPVLLGWHLLAYTEMLERDLGRLKDARFRLNECPLGSGALAGTTLEIDREFVARELDFVDQLGQPRITQNSMDAVSDRDFVVEFVAALALLMVHLSRLAEDLVLWSTAEFGFVRIADAYTTGSSLMPQKRNPDVAELVRGKAARVIGDLNALLILMKGLPMTYNRDLQEDKERLFDAADTAFACVNVMSSMLRNLEINKERCAAAVSDPLMCSTDLVDYLVRKGLPFRQAHHLVGQIVAVAEEIGVSLRELPLEKWREVCPLFEADVFSLLDPKQAVAARKAPGTPSPTELQRQIERWKTIFLREGKQ